MAGAVFSSCSTFCSAHRDGQTSLTVTGVGELDIPPVLSQWGFTPLVFPLLSEFQRLIQSFVGKVNISKER